MNKPEILGVEVLTPDGRGSILSLHHKRVTVRLNTIGHNQVMKGTKREEMNYSYEYEDVEFQIVLNAEEFGKDWVQFFRAEELIAV